MCPPHSSSTRRVGKRCAKKIELIRSSSGEQGSFLQCVTYFEIKLFFLILYQNQDKTGHFSSIHRKVCVRCILKINVF